MKKILILFWLTLGLYPVLKHDKLQLTVITASADSWGDEGSGNDGGGINDDDIYNSLSGVLGMDIVGSSDWMGHTVFNLGDGSIWDPTTSNLDDVEIEGVKEEIIDAYPELFLPDSPEADPDSYETLEDIILYITEYQQQEPLEKKDPCDEAKALTAALNEAMEMQEAKDRMNQLKGTKNSPQEHAFYITRDAEGKYHVTEMVTGTDRSASLSHDSKEQVVFIVHTHTPDASAAPSSTDIYGLHKQEPGFMGNIIMHENNMYVLSITDQQAYDKFVAKSEEKGYYDKDALYGWKAKTLIDREFESFSRGYAKMYPGVDATYPTQLHLMDYFKMGTTLQKWDAESGKFNPQELNTEANNDTGSSASISMSGNSINSIYKKIEVNKKDCPD